jgi:PilZ domain
MSVKLRESKQGDSRYNERRRGHRMNSRVPVRLEWNDGSGSRISVDAHTRVINPYGCMVVLPQSLNLEHRLALTNLASNTSNAAIVVWKGNDRPDGWEYGVELVAPEMDFWGLEL